MVAISNRQFGLDDPPQVKVPRTTPALKKHMEESHRSRGLGVMGPDRIEAWHETLHSRPGLHILPGAGQDHGWDHHTHE